MPILYCHGAPGCGAEAITLAKAAAEHGARILAVNRPGFAGSSLQTGRTMLDWPDDAVAVADEVGVGALPVFGYSGGGPYALVCGVMRPDRFPLVGVAAGAGPYQGRTSLHRMSPSDRRMTLLALHAPRLGRAVLRAVGLGTAMSPGIALRSWMIELPDADRRVLEDAEIPARDAMFFMVDAMRHGVQGALLDYRLLSLPWGFEPGDITVPVRWWHGTDDQAVPFAEVEGVIQSLADATLCLVPDAGHLLLGAHADDIVTSLVGR
ncbi:MAG: alpha/beta hydrolase [Pseudonocardiales bacterium]|nr:alpha/beta hydrolase [Pseudonocardiales bacterium]